MFTKVGISRWVKKNQFIAFGTPFLLSMAIGSYAFAGISQIKYDHSDRKTKSAIKSAQLGIDEHKKKKTVDELYFDLMSMKDGDAGFEDWDFVRVERPEGEAENVYWKK